MPCIPDTLCPISVLPGSRSDFNCEPLCKGATDTSCREMRQPLWAPTKNGGGGGGIEEGSDISGVADDSIR
jgi:hypothetical protein